MNYSLECNKYYTSLQGVFALSDWLNPKGVGSERAIVLTDRVLFHILAGTLCSTMIIWRETLYHNDIWLENVVPMILWRENVVPQ